MNGLVAISLAYVVGMILWCLFAPRSDDDDDSDLYPR